MPTLLLINPRFPESFWSFTWLMDRVMTEHSAMTAPLGLATLAALCPPDWDIVIHDEEVSPLPDDIGADIVGVCGMGVQRPRQRELLKRFRAQGCYTVAGGSYASLCPEDYEGEADSVVAGEAEYIWPQFCKDYTAGRPEALYHEKGTVDLADSPVPRFDLLDIDKYHSMPLQFSRGCPFRCEFCDIIVMFGRKPRTKAPEQVIRELDALRKLGARWPFFVDDNFIGHRPKARELLTAVQAYQEEHGYPFRLGTEASLDLAKDLPLLAQMRDAGFAWLFTGIETPDENALKEAKKFQNLRMDSLDAIKVIYEHGLDIYAGFIVGFDQDDLGAIERQRDFIVASGIQVAILNILSAIPKTPLYERLEAEGRIIESTHGHIDTGLGTNLIPKAMEYDELVEGFRQIWIELQSDKLIADRVKNKTRMMNPPAFNESWPVSYQVRLLGRLLVRGILPGGPSRWYHFTRSLPWDAVSKLGLALGDWTRALSLRDYVDRNMAEPAAKLGPIRANPPKPMPEAAAGK